MSIKSKLNPSRQSSSNYWQDVINDFEKSGIPISKYCSMHKISTSSFYQWRKILEAGRSNEKSSIPSFIPIDIQIRAQATNRSQALTAKKEFVFKGLIKCAVTGRLVSADRKEDKTNKNTYLITWDPENTAKKIYVAEDLILSEVTGIFESIAIPHDILQKVTERYNNPTKQRKRITLQDRTVKEGRRCY